MRDIAQIIAQVNAGELPATLTGPQRSTEALDQSEIVGLRELHTLAAKLTRRNNPQHSRLGRALTKALAGEEMAAHGARNATAYQLAGEIIEAYPFADPLSVTEHFRVSISLSQSRGSKLTPEIFVRQLETHQSKKQGHAETLRDIGEGVTLPTHAGPPGTEPANLVPGAPAINSPEARGTKDVIVLADGTYYIRHPLGETYELTLKSSEAFRLEIINQFGNANATLNLIDPMGRLYTNEVILAQYGSNATGGIVKDFAADATRFDSRTAVLRIGQRMLSPEQAEPSAPVEAWLKAIAGDTDEALTDLYDWIASTDQRYINRPATALAIVGTKDAAKSLFGRALAMTWGALNAAPMACVVERFNGALQDCPIWHADEEMPPELTGHVFRDLVQSRDRYIEPKGKEKVRLLGAPRLLITVNQIEDIRIKGANGPDAVDAIADRLTIYQAAPRERMAEVTNALRLPGSYDLDLQQIVRHLRYVQLNLVPREQRFYGGRGGGDETIMQILLGAVETCAELFELFYQWFVDPHSIEKEYRAEASSFGLPGRAFPIISEDGGLYVRPAELTARLGVKDGWRVRNALKPFERPPSRNTQGKGRDQISFGAGKTRFRFVRLDAERLIVALGVDIDTAAMTLAIETRHRIGR
jgi:hypothetical protein